MTEQQASDLIEIASTIKTLLWLILIMVSAIIGILFADRSESRASSKSTYATAMNPRRW